MIRNDMSIASRQRMIVLQVPVALDAAWKADLIVKVFGGEIYMRVGDFFDRLLWNVSCISLNQSMHEFVT